MAKTTKKSLKTDKRPSTDSPAQDSASTKRATTRPGKKVISLIVDEKWAARVSLCARALGKSQTQYIVEIVSKSLKTNLASALAALKAEVE